MEHKVEFKNLIDSFLEKHSPFKNHDLVFVKSFGPSKRPYEITKVSVTEDGEIYYQLTSPRSHSSLPNRFKISDLEKI